MNEPTQFNNQEQSYPDKEILEKVLGRDNVNNGEQIIIDLKDLFENHPKIKNVVFSDDEDRSINFANIILLKNETLHPEDYREAKNEFKKIIYKDKKIPETTTVSELARFLFCKTMNEEAKKILAKHVDMGHMDHGKDGLEHPNKYITCPS